jgi:hypothetical protein
MRCRRLFAIFFADEDVDAGGPLLRRGCCGLGDGLGGDTTLLPFVGFFGFFGLVY